MRSTVPFRRVPFSPAALLVLSALLTGCGAIAPIGDRSRLPLHDFDFDDPNTTGWMQLDRADHPTEPIVQIRVFRVPDVEAVALHGYFFAFDPETDRFITAEVDGYLRSEFGVERGTVYVFDRSVGESVEQLREVTAFGYHRRREGIIHVELDHPVVAEWRGEEAARIIAVLREEYPAGAEYQVWPGANSNSYVTWVLRRARVPFDPHPMMVGKDHRGPWGFGAGISPGRAGVQLETPLVGALVDLRQGVEVHVFCLTLGVDLWPPALKTPFGRVGFAPSR